MNAHAFLLSIQEENEQFLTVIFGELNGFRYETETKLEKGINYIYSDPRVEHLLKQFSFQGGFESACCPPTVIHSTTRVLFVTEYDGSTQLRSIYSYPYDDADVSYF